MSRRKPTLQIHHRQINRNTPDKEYPNNKSGAGLGLLGTYNEDSDDGDNDSHDDEQENLPKSTLDSKVADFLKEIDDLDVAVAPTSKNAKKKEKQPEVEKIKRDETKNPSNENNNEISWGLWQQCIDENTQHPYYWNTSTNEVTWTLPAEIEVQYNKNTQEAVDEPSREEVTAKEDTSKHTTLTNESYLLSKTSLKSAILENSKVHAASKYEKEKKTPSESWLESYNTYHKPEKKSKSVKPAANADEDVGCTLLSLTTAASRRRAHEDDAPDPQVAEVPSKRHKSPAMHEHTKESEVSSQQDGTKEKQLQPRDNEQKERSSPTEVEPSTIMKSDVDDEVDLKSKTSLWMQWEDELAQKEKNLKGQEIEMTQSDVDGNAKKEENVVEEEEDTKEDDLAKYDMMAMEESSSRSESMPTPLEDDKSHQSDLSTDAVVQPALEEDVETSTKETEDPMLESDDLKNSIENSVAELTKKLSSLETSKSTIPLLHVLLVEIETRMTDWKAGELTDDYLKMKLAGALQSLTEYENSKMPQGWSCHWDSRYCRYYYTNTRGRTQWDHPLQEEADDVTRTLPEEADDRKETETDHDVVNETSSPDEKDEIEVTNIPEPASGISNVKVEPDVATSESNPTESTSREESTKVTATVTNSTTTVLKANQPTTTADNTDKSSTAFTGAGSYAGVSGGMMDYGSYNMHNYYWNMPNQYGIQYGSNYSHHGSMPGYDESYRHSPMNDLPPPPPGEDAAPLPPTAEPAPPPLPPGEAEDSVPPPPPAEPEPSPPAQDEDGIEMEISDVEDEIPPPPIPEMRPTVTELRRGPVEYSTVVSSAPVLNTAGQQKSAIVTKPALTATSDKLKKGKKPKKDKSASKKPPKQMFGMVAKWQKAKQEIEDEEKRLIMESEAELDREMDVKHRIKKWKMEQLQSGKASTNANFQPISDDWKKRVKARKSKIS